MNLENAARVARTFLECTGNYLGVELEAIQNMGEIWVCLFRLNKLEAVHKHMGEVFVGDERVVGFRKLPERES